ncbi:hypothetical protein ACF068_18255 [Streptomyces sp. NPDC016309]|uniref:hypothetical protein n=1 Tax=Streptomyces sp. NPDC016309 TaxID=3364965 RepID=UPI0036FF3CA3
MGLGLSGGAHRRAGLCLVAATTLLVPACTRDARPDAPTRTRVPVPAPSIPPPDDAAGLTAALDRAFTGRRSLAAGSGPLSAHFGDTLPGPPAGVRGVTLAFLCTGNATVALRFSVGAAQAPPGPAEVCDGSLVQRHLDVTRPGPVSIDVTVNGPHRGGYAYASYDSYASYDEGEPLPRAAGAAAVTRTR